MKNYNLAAKNQYGAVLFISLILLLIITVLAISSIRGTALESRLTANTVENKRLFNATEAGLREGERRIANSLVALDSCGSIPCIKSLATTYDTDFSTAHAYTGLDGTTGMSRNVHWYIRLIQPGATDSQAENVKYGEEGKNLGKKYYEVNSQAYNSAAGVTNASSNCSVDVVCLRSVVARVFTE